MAAPNERAAIKALADQRASLEAEMEAVLTRLNAPGMPGVTGRLVDAEGFPRADIDLHAVRNDRHRLAVLKTDYTRVCDALERSLHALHAAALAGGGGAAPSAASPASEPKRPRLNDSGAAPMETSDAGTPPPPPPLAAFALIDEVSADSPAAAAGLAVGDALLSLGEVRCGSGGAAAALAALGPQVAASEGRSLAVQVLRRGERLSLALTPRRWAGRGLLGCHLRPLS